MMTNGTPKISVIICTYNGAKHLERVLQTVVRQSLSSHLYEILVVDNCSTDATKEIVLRYKEKNTNILYIYEEKLGLCNARNAGMANARAEYVAFLDDDAFACPDWLGLILKAFESNHPAPSAVGGKILLEWQGERPEWLPEWALRMLTYIDYGPNGKFLDYSKYEYPFGANMAFRRKDIMGFGCFNPAFDRSGKKLLSNGDKSVFLRMHELGMKVYYEPDAYVHHLAHADRITKEFLNRRQYWQGISDVLLYYAHPSTVSERARFRFYAKSVIDHYKKSLNQSSPTSQRVFHRYNAWYYWGCLVQEIRMTAKGEGLIFAIKYTLQHWYGKISSANKVQEGATKRNEMANTGNLPLHPLIPEIQKKTSVSILPFSIDKEEFEEYLLSNAYSSHGYGKSVREKALEHFVSLKILKPKADDVFMDVASMDSPVTQIVKKLYGSTVYRQDLSYPPGIREGNVGSDAGSMPFPGNAITFMTLHCSFEHFEGDADTRFIREAARVLKPGGKVCILPLYLASQFVNQTDTSANQKDLVFDEGAIVRDHPAKQRFGRLYSIDKLKERILDHCGSLVPTIYVVENEKDVDPLCYLKFILVLEKPVREETIISRRMSIQDHPLVNPLHKKTGISVVSYHIDVRKFDDFYNRWEYEKMGYASKWVKEKALEHFVSLDLITLSKEDIFIDIASMYSPVAKKLREDWGCVSYSQDLVFPEGVHGDRVGGSATNLPFPDRSVSYMTLHCSFEHFEGDADTLFVKEAERVLKLGGKVCILPLYLNEEFIKLSDMSEKYPDLVFDKDAVIRNHPAGQRFGRQYSIEKLKERVLDHCSRLIPTIYVVDNENEIDPLCYLKFILVLSQPDDSVQQHHSGSSEKRGDVVVKSLSNVNFTQANTAYECSLCGSKISSFLPFGMRKNTPPRPNAQCPVCKSLERHRLIWLYFRNRTNLFSTAHKMLHVAPELLLMDKLCSCPNIDYLSADLDSSLAMVKMDITDIHYPDNSFDVIYCSHVLEHIPDDQKAMRELCRVLRPGGWAILQVPLWGPKTIEDPSITTPEDRERVFYQFDHVRHYGHDGVYRQRLENAGFTVKVDPYIKELGEENSKRYGLMAGEDIYFCTKSVPGKSVQDISDRNTEKGAAEMVYWRERIRNEGVLKNAHYEYFYTTHFGLNHEYYKGKKILDIGCGPRGSLEWADLVAERIGLDPLGDMYKELGTSRHRMKYVASGSEDIPFSKNYFDVIASFNSLDHVDDLDRTIAEIKRVLKPGGFFLLLTELGHDPTPCEPVVFAWDITERFTDMFSVVEERHFERSLSGMYDSIHANVPYDHSKDGKRYGILSVKFIKL